MKRYTIAVLLFCTTIFAWGQVGIGTTNPSEKAALEISSQVNGAGEYRGFMPPRIPNVSSRQTINPLTTDVGLQIYLQSTGCLQIWNGISWENVKCISNLNNSAWINEFHYENIGADSGEFIEIAGPAGTDLSTYQLVLYNSIAGTTYNTRPLTGIIPNQMNNYGTLSFTYTSASPIQNALNGPDAIALVRNSIVIQFLSYNGVMTATNGPANGMTSIDIGVIESNNTTPVGFSLRLTGTGNLYTDFVWNAPAIATPGLVNTGQAF